jgi:hypothetical protein
MSFNLLKFKKPQIEKIENQELKVDFVCVGFDAKTLFDILATESFHHSSFLFLDQNERTIAENLKLIDSLPYPWTFDVDSNQDAKFFKDGEFRSFNGRHKINNCHPYLLKFKHKNYQASWFKWWENTLSDDIKTKLNESLLLGQVKAIFYRDNTWELHTFDHKIIKANRIKWNLSPELFLKLFRHEQQYPKNFLTWCSHFKPLNFLLLQFSVHPKVNENLVEGLIPLTMGTDEGYFLLTKQQVSENEENLNLLYVFENSELQEEDVANRIRLMKKQLSKIFGLTDKILAAEKVFFLPHFTFTSEADVEEVSNFIQPDAIFDFDQQYFSINSNAVNEMNLKLNAAIESITGDQPTF